MPSRPEQDDWVRQVLGIEIGSPKPTVAPSGTSMYDTLRGDGQLVAYRKLLLEWDAAQKQARTQIVGLKKAIAKVNPAFAKSADMLDGLMDRLGGTLSDAIDAALNAEGMSARSSAHVDAGKVAKAYLMTVNFDPVFKMVDNNPIKPLTVGPTLAGALKKLVAALPS